MNINDLISALGIKNIYSYEGINPYGMRYSSSYQEPFSIKGKGYFGFLPHSEGGQATELSFGTDVGTFPLLVPTLSKTEIKFLLQGNEPTEEIIKKAEDWAIFRMNQGFSPFSQPQELRIPVGLLD